MHRDQLQAAKTGAVAPVAPQYYVDKLSFAVVWQLMRVADTHSVTVLDNITGKQKFWMWALRVKGVDVVEAAFFAGQLRTPEGESVCTAARAKAARIALNAARRIVESEPVLKCANEGYGRNTIRLFIAKQLHLYTEYWTLRIMVAQALHSEQQIVIWLRRPDRFDPSLLEEAFPDARLGFYSMGVFRLMTLVRWWALAVARDTAKWALNVLRDRSRRIDRPDINKSSVMVFQENINIRADRRLRAQPHHWLTVNHTPKNFNIYVIETRSFKTAASETDKAKLAHEGVILISETVIGDAVREMKNKTVVEKARDQRHVMMRAAFRANSFAGGLFLLRVGLLMKEAEKMAALVLWLNAKVFINREPQFGYSDAMQLVAPELNVATIAYQYSHMGMSSTLMMSTADKFLVFADMCKALYDVDGITPRDFVVGGYLYDGVTNFVREKALEHRKMLERMGASFVVCYFDESVQHDRWGMVSEAEHRGELHALASAVLSDSSFGVVVKSQFMRNSPSQRYSDDELIQTAKATGRFLELMEGVHVNEIYPTEAALVADLCISHKFGATAGLEAAVAGIRTVLLDAHGTRTLWDDIYATADIEYTSMDVLLEAIMGLRSGASENQSLGDWSAVLHCFDPYRDGKAAERFYDVISKAVYDNDSETVVERQPFEAYGQV